MSERNYMIGMDMGTTNIKAIVLRDDGELVAEASLPNTVSNPGPNMQEQDANEWWDHSREIFQKVTGALAPEERKRIRTVGISSQTVCLVPLDADYRPVRPALTCVDGRSYEEMHELVNAIGEERFIRIVGGQAAPTFLPSKILWFKRHEPEFFAKTAYYSQASSFINARLTGVLVTDVDQAQRTQCLDVKTMDWSREIGEAIGVDLDKVLPPISLVKHVIGQVTEQAAQQTGIPAGTPVIAGCSDAMSAMFAMGLSELGQAGESSGTTSLVFVGTDTKSAPDLPIITRPCPVEGMPWLYDAPVMSSGSAIKWYIDTIARIEVETANVEDCNIYEYLNHLALDRSEPGARGLFFFPYLMGERAPLWNDYARGMMIGLRMDTKRADFARAVFEGTAFALRHVVETIRKEGVAVNSLRICGGGSRSRTWNMIKASMLHVPVQILADGSGDVPLGSALLAGYSVGLFEDLTAIIEKLVKVEEVIEPVPTWETIYDKLYPYFVDMYEHLDEDLARLQKTMVEIDGI